MIKSPRRECEVSSTLETGRFIRQPERYSNTLESSSVAYECLFRVVILADFHLSVPMVCVQSGGALFIAEYFDEFVHVQ